MRRVLWLGTIFILLLAGCISSQSAVNITSSPEPNLAETISSGISATQTAVIEDFRPAPPYSPLDLAELLIPGESLEREWQPSTVYDLTQPYPGLPDWCGDYYGSCGQNWPGVVDYGVQLKLIHQGGGVGEVVFLYYHDLEAIDEYFQNNQIAWSHAAENLEGLEVWFINHNPYERPPLGDKWVHFLQYFLFDESTNTDPEQRKERELLGVKIAFVRCHALVRIELDFPPQTSAYNPDDMELRPLEQEAFFDLVYAYAQEVDQNIAPYGCNE